MLTISPWPGWGHRHSRGSGPRLGAARRRRSGRAGCSPRQRATWDHTSGSSLKSPRPVTLNSPPEPALSGTPLWSENHPRSFRSFTLGEVGSMNRYNPTVTEDRSHRMHPRCPVPAQRGHVGRRCRSASPPRTGPARARAWAKSAQLTCAGPSVTWPGRFGPCSPRGRGRHSRGCPRTGRLALGRSRRQRRGASRRWRRGRRFGNGLRAFHPWQ